ncbi:hypothetical protein [Paracoccus sediminicola]|uniref:hypothetical protein n=1 Tax=Paracoccus sediminicola TaxID=3017783 RepID=UPI0022F09D6F|nr:hypothetical protein [Paracoccus sediminicola]WBU56940.1 hypothetical protein PAF18_00390 [Paracoccus sediminicola]
MLKKFLPILLALFCAAAGAIGGQLLRPDNPALGSGDMAEVAEGDRGSHGEGSEAKDAPQHDAVVGADKAVGKGGERSYFRFPSQFFVPVMRGSRLDGMMVLSLALEMPKDMQEEIYRQEFRLRDGLLRTLLIQANTGGFDGNFTVEARMRSLREALLKTARDLSDGVVTDVLIEDIARQDSS